MKGLGSSSGPDPSFKTPQVVRPKLKQSPAVGAPDPMTRVDGPCPLDDEDYVGEFVPPSQRLPTYFESFLSCGVFLASPRPDPRRRTRIRRPTSPAKTPPSLNSS